MKPLSRSRPHRGLLLGAVAILVAGRFMPNALSQLFAPSNSVGSTAMVLLAGVGTAGTTTPGGQRNVGRLFAEQLSTMGADVACIARSQAAAEELKGIGCRVAGVGDLMDEDFARGILNSLKPMTVFSSVGGKTSDGKRVDGVANVNLFKAASELQVKPNIVFVTSWGCGETWDYLDERTREILGPALKAKTEAEEFLRNSGLPFMIVRPGGLLAEPEATKRGIFIRRPDVGGAIRRQDLAEMLVWLPRRPETQRQAVTALDQDMMKADPPLQQEDILPFAGPGD